MSAIKRYLDDLCTTVTDAVTDEIMDMPECLEFCRDDVEEETMGMIIDGKYDDLFNYLNSYIAEVQNHDEMPKTRTAMKALLPHISNECLSAFKSDRV